MKNENATFESSFDDLSTAWCGAFAVVPILAEARVPVLHRSSICALQELQGRVADLHRRAAASLPVFDTRGRGLLIALAFG
jgi:hypothetical protein